MARDNLQVAGSFLFIGAAQFIVMMIVAEALYPGYNVSTNFISDLGATCRSSCIIEQPTSTVFNSSIVILGALGVVGSYFFYNGTRSRAITPILVLAALGAIGVGLFPETTGIFHTLFSLITFLFAGLSGIATFRLQKAPMSYFSVILGLMTLVALFLYASGIYLGLGGGGMERMIAYPALVWLAAFGSHLIAKGESPYRP